MCKPVFLLGRHCNTQAGHYTSRLSLLTSIKFTTFQYFLLLTDKAVNSPKKFPLICYAQLGVLSDELFR